MALFSRNRNQIDQVPAEVQEYYQAERRERTGMAWLLALATLAGTVALAAALFYGGKWVYRAVANRDNKPTTAQNGNQGSGSQNQGQDGSAGAPTGTSSTNTETPSPAPAPNPGGAAPQQQGSGPSSGASSSGAGAAASSTSALVNTGPEHVVASFVLVSAGGAVAHYVYMTRRARS